MGRKYTFDNYGFISQAEILVNIFEKPMSFKISINGKEVVFSPERSTLLEIPRKAEICQWQNRRRGY